MHSRALQGALSLRVLLWALMLGNVATVIHRITQIVGPHIASSRLAAETRYTWRGLDYPHVFPSNRLDNVAMTLHESVRLSLNVSSPVAEREWQESTVMTDIGHGRVRLGPDHHIFIVAHLHQTHCLRVFQHALLGTPAKVGESDGSPEHFNHCLDYLRRTLLCAADDTLEKGDFMTRDFETERIGETLVCEDWERLYADMGQNFAEWSEWSRQWN